MDAISDGMYDVIVVSADEGSDGSIAMEIAFTSGDLKGTTTTLRASIPLDHALTMLGLPLTLHVQDGRPRIAFD